MLGGASDYVSCPACGTSVGREVLSGDEHRCDARQRDAHVVELAVAGVELFEADLGSWLETPHGRFETYYARRSRSRS